MVLINIRSDLFFGFDKYFIITYIKIKITTLVNCHSKKQSNVWSTYQVKALSVKTKNNTKHKNNHVLNYLMIKNSKYSAILLKRLFSIHNGKFKNI